MTQRIISSLLLLATLRINYLSSSGGLGENLLILRDIFPFAYMPAGWTFGVAWGLIYFTLIVWCIRSRTPTGSKNKLNQKLHPIFRVSCVLNIIWIICTAQERYVRSVLIITRLMFTLRYILDIISTSKKPYTFIRIPFGLYAGWVTMATSIVGFSQFMYSFNAGLPVSRGRTMFILVFGCSVAGYLFMKHKNRAQLAITLIALAGIANSMGVF